MPGPVPPSPERRPTTLEAHGDRRVDDWYWLRDATDPAVISHLESENAYADEVLARLNPLCEGLYREMVARIAETDLSVPVRHGPWWYYHRTEEGRDYAVHCRCPAHPGDDPPVSTVAASGEQVLLDENAMAEGLEFFQVGNLAISPGHRWLAYATDTSGAERYDLAFRWVGEGEAPLSATEVIPGTYYGLAWANDEATVFYTRVDEAMRPYQLWRHRLGSDPADDALVLEEPDERFTLSVGRTKDGRFVVVALHSTTTSDSTSCLPTPPSGPPGWSRRAARASSTPSSTTPGRTARAASRSSPTTVPSTSAWSSPPPPNPTAPGGPRWSPTGRVPGSTTSTSSTTGSCWPNGSTGSPACGSWRSIKRAVARPGRSGAICSGEAGSLRQTSTRRSRGRGRTPSPAQRSCASSSPRSSRRARWPTWTWTAATASSASVNRSSATSTRRATAPLAFGSTRRRPQGPALGGGARRAVDGTR